VGADVGADVALVLLDALDVVAMATLLKESKDPMISKVDTVNFMVRRLVLTGAKIGYGCWNYELWILLSTTRQNSVRIFG